MCIGKFNKFIFSVVIISMILNLFPLNILASEIFNDDSNDTVTEENIEVKDEEKDEEKEVTIKGEIIDAREENVKKFLNSDNTVTAAIYPYPVHYMNNNKWEDIDNSLSEITDNNGNKKLQNNRNNYKVSFEKEIENEKVVSVEKDNYKVSWSLVGANKVTTKKTDNSNLKNKNKQLNSEEETLTLDKIGSNVKYENVFKNVDLEYNVIADQIKESIVLKDKDSKKDFKFKLDVGNLYPKLNDDNSISIYKSSEDEEVIYTIQAPYMYDANTEYCDKFQVKLYKEENDYYLEIIPDKEWINADERIYPIVIDPTIETSLKYTAIQDTFIYPTDYSYNGRYDAHILRAGSGIVGPKRTLIKFELPKLEAGDQVVDARLWLCNYPETYEWTPTTRQIQLNVHRITKDWAQETASWSNMADNSYDTRVSDYFIYSYDANNPFKFNSCNVTSIVKDWYVSGNNYGLMLKEPTETATGQNEAYFLSANTNSVYTEGRPQVVITYRNATGVENYWSYHEQEVGRAGVGQVNDYNGNLVFTHADVQTPGDRMPVSLYHTYNSNDIGEDLGFGKGWRLNLSQSVQLVKISETDYAKYIDEDGTRHYFVKQGSTNTYLDEDGLGLKLTLNGDSTFTMTDKSDNKLIFAKKMVNNTEFWHLQQIIDTSGNKTTISFLQNDGFFYINKVTDAAGSTVTVNWTNGRISSIVDQDNKTIYYNYDSNWNLTSITYPDGKKSIYTYTSNSLITSAKNIDNSRVEYSYYNVSPFRLKEIKEYSTENEIGNSLTMSYGENTTTLVDNKNNSNLYNFNDFGNATSIADFGNQKDTYSTAYGKAFKYGTSGGEKNKIKLDSKLSTTVSNLLRNHGAEQNGYWDYAVWGTTSGSASTSSEAGYSSPKSLKVVNDTATNDARTMYVQKVNATKGKKYTLSAQIKTNISGEVNSYGSNIFMYYTKSDGTRVVKEAEYIKQTSDWTKQVVTIDYPSDATSELNVAIGIANQKGTAYFDSLQLEEGEVANTYNLVENSSFSQSLDYWEKNGDTNGNDTIANVSNNNVAKFTGEYQKNKMFKQNVKVSGKSGDIFNISAWVKNLGIRNEGNKSCRISVCPLGTAGQGDWIDFPINADSTAWQYSSNEFTVKYDYNSIDVYLVFSNQSNEAYFDNISLLKDDFGQSYTYDKNGNLISSQDMNKQNSTIQYNGRNELLKQTDVNGGSFVYEYDSQVKNRLTSAMNNSKIKYTFEYDQYGNTTSTKIDNKDKVSASVVAGKTYYIRSKSSGLYLDGYLGLTDSGTNVNQYYFNGFGSQKWIAYDAGNGYYGFKYANSTDKSLDYNGKLQIFSTNYSEFQQFKLIKNIDGSFRIVSRNNENDNALTIVNNSKEKFGKILEEKFENKDSQSFYFEEVGVDNSEDKSVVESGEVFYIKSKSSSLYLDYMKDSNGSNSDINGRKLAQENFTGNDTQKWRLIRKNNGSYKLIPISSITGRALDLDSGRNENNNPVQVYDYVQDTPNQEWRIYKEDGNTYSIGSVTTNGTKRLTVKNNSNNAGEQIVVYEYGEADNQKWYLEPVNSVNIEDGATYKIKSKASGLYLGIINKQDQNGPLLKQLIDNAQNGEEWKFVDLKNGYYKIVAAHSSSGRVIEVAGGISTNGTSIKQWEWNGTEAQQWEFVPVGDGSFSIKPRLIKGRSALDVPGGLSTPENTLQVYDSNNTTSQHFYIEKVSKPTSEYIESKATYKENGRFVDTITDSIGNKVTYNYNFVNNSGSGTLKETIDAKGNKTNYEYDNLNRITKTELVGQNNTYTNSYQYDNDKISSIIHNGFNIDFIYDNFGNTKQVKIADQTLVTNNYGANNGNLQSVQYGNNQTMSYEYDRFNRVSKKTGTNGTQEYIYDAKGNLGVQKDNVNNITYRYIYDLADRLVEINSTDNFKVNYSYDKNSNINNIKYNLLSLSNEIKYSYDNDNKITSIKLDENKYVMYNYDTLSRLKERKITSGTNSYKTEFTYLTSDTNPLQTTNILKSIKNGTNGSIDYTYDKNGNIERIEEDGVEKQKYYYDELNQLIREDNRELNETKVYTYDAGGNIQKVDTYEYTEAQNITDYTIIDTKVYTYDSAWKDKLTSYDGKEITYDEIGNPLTYGSNTYTWENGRQLSSVNTGDKEITYRYNDSGIRTEKTVNGVTTKYYLDGDKVIYETTGDNTIYYQYDGEGNLIGFKYNNEDYYYVRNGQGDITGILDKDLKEVISYTYDTWGKIISIKDGAGVDVTNNSSGIGNINPYRYRGYRYDNETGMYYLNSRYYNPEWCRMINSDGEVSARGQIQGYNLFTYCFNNPVNMQDPSGNWPSWGQIFTAVAIAAVTAVAVVAVVATAGAAGVAVGVAASMYLGVSASAAVAIGTVATVGAYTIAAGIAATGASNIGEVFTGKNVIRDKVMGGNQKAYDAVQIGLAVAGMGVTSVGAVGVASASSSKMKYPGNDPAKCNVKGFEWKGSGSPISGKGNFVNSATGEWLHPDLKHGPPIGPHWDYGVRGSAETFRIFPDGSVRPK